MPIHTVKKGSQICYQWGAHGVVYCGAGARRKAARQASAAYANGYKGKESLSELKASLSPEELEEFEQIEQEEWEKQNPALAIVEKIAAGLKENK